MATQVFNRFESETPAVFMVRDILPGAGWAPYQAESQVCAIETEPVSAVTREDGDFFTGALAALSLEAGLAVCVWGVRLAWHLFR